MTTLEALKKHLRPGKVYRREDLARHSTSVDRHLETLVREGELEKLRTGLYYRPKQSAFGPVPPDEQELVRAFLRDHYFLFLSPHLYNRLGLGTTQLYNTRVVYNHKRHGRFDLGGRTFDFRMKPRFPTKPTPEFLLVDLVNNVDSVGEDQDELLEKVLNKVQTMDRAKLKRAVTQYASAFTKKLFHTRVFRAA